MTRKDRTEAQEVDIMRRWIYRAFARELYKWFAAHVNPIPMNGASFRQIQAICRTTLGRWPDPVWSVEIVEPDREARAQRRGPTVVLRYRDVPV